MDGRLGNLPRSIELVRRGGQAVFAYVDQRALPSDLKTVETRDWRDVVGSISTLAVRGAPAIGVSGAAALALWACAQPADRQASGLYLEELERVAEEVASARPTAVNLRWAVERARDYARSLSEAAASAGEVACALVDFVGEMERDDERANRRIGENGAALLEAGSRVLTHCNAGSLATCYYGTALGIVYSAFAQGRVERVFADETRPVGQGARLTAWELAQVGVPVTLICDDMAASLMAQGGVDAVIVGADRIAANGDVANKIGTYGVAVLAHEHGIPFYVAAPTSTVDLAIADGSEIVIEQRDASEVLEHPIAGVEVWNPAFDVTPARYVTKIVTENGVFSPGDLAHGVGLRL